MKILASLENARSGRIQWDVHQMSDGWGVRGGGRSDSLANTHKIKTMQNNIKHYMCIYIYIYIYGCICLVRVSGKGYRAAFLRNHPHKHPSRLPTPDTHNTCPNTQNTIQNIQSTSPVTQNTLHRFVHESARCERSGSGNTAKIHDFPARVFLDRSQEEHRHTFSTILAQNWHGDGAGVGKGCKRGGDGMGTGWGQGGDVDFQILTDLFVYFLIFIVYFYIYIYVFLYFHVF